MCVGGRWAMRPTLGSGQQVWLWGPHCSSSPLSSPFLSSQAPSPGGTAFNLTCSLGMMKRPPPARHGGVGRWTRLTIQGCGPLGLGSHIQGVRTAGLGHHSRVPGQLTRLTIRRRKSKAPAPSSQHSTCMSPAQLHTTREADTITLPSQQKQPGSPTV